MDATVNVTNATRHRRFRPRGVPADIQLAIDAEAEKGFGGAEIHRTLSLDPRMRDRLPLARTIQRMVRERRSGGLPWGDLAAGARRELAWRMQNASPAEVALVLPALAEVIDQTEGRTDYLTVLEAAWAARIRMGARGLSLRWVVWLAMTCAARESQAGPGRDATSPYDKLLALAPWKSEEAWERYTKFVGQAHPEWLPTNREGKGIEGVVLDACRIRADRTGRSVLDIIGGLWEQQDQLGVSKKRGGSNG